MVRNSTIPFLGRLQQPVCRLDFVYGPLHSYVKVSRWLGHNKYEQATQGTVWKRELCSSHNW